MPEWWNWANLRVGTFRRSARGDLRREPLVMVGLSGHLDPKLIDKLHSWLLLHRISLMLTRLKNNRDPKGASLLWILSIYIRGVVSLNVWAVEGSIIGYAIGRREPALPMVSQVTCGEIALSWEWDLDKGRFTYLIHGLSILLLVRHLLQL